MSLNYDLSNIKDFKTVCYKDGSLDPFVKSAIWACMAVGLSGITEKNIDEWVFRLSLMYIKKTSPFGKMYKDHHVQHLPKVYELTPLIGLRTNVYNESRTRWIKTQLCYLTTDARHIYERRLAAIDDLTAVK